MVGEPRREGEKLVILNGSSDSDESTFQLFKPYSRVFMPASGVFFMKYFYKHYKDYLHYK